MELYYQEYGNRNASLMVFLHGGGVSSWMWDEQVVHFTDYHCMTIDLPEQGKSKGTDQFSVHKSAEQISKLIKKKANGKQVIAVGFSLGAQVLIQILSMHPDLIHSAVINSALVRPNKWIRKMIRPSIKVTFPLIRNRRFSKLQSKVLHIRDEQFERYYKESSQMNSSTLIRILEENMSFSIPASFINTNSKLLVTVGEKEKAVMKKSALDIVLKNPNAAGIIIPSAGHGVSLANPIYFNQMIENWLMEGVVPLDALSIN